MCCQYGMVVYRCLVRVVSCRRGHLIGVRDSRFYIIRAPSKCPKPHMIYSVRLQLYLLNDSARRLELSFPEAEQMVDTLNTVKHKEHTGTCSVLC
jgi:hypothetical protein